MMRPSSVALVAISLLIRDLCVFLLSRMAALRWSG
jgi:hypothetical protein